MPETENWTQINVAAPIPLDVAATLMSLIGAAYPTAVVDTHGQSNHWDGRPQFALSMRINPAERAKRVTKKAAAEVKAHADETVEADLLGLQDGVLHATTPKEISLFLGGLAHQMFDQTEGAVNYVEWEVRTEDGDRYVLCFAKSKKQTPGAMLRELRDNANALTDRIRARAKDGDPADLLEEILTELDALNATTPPGEGTEEPM